MGRAPVDIGPAAVGGTTVVALLDTPRGAVLGLATGVALYSLSPVLVRASNLSGTSFAFWRLWLAVPVLQLLWWHRHRSRPLETLAREGVPIAVAGVSLAANQVLMLSALRLTSVADVTLIGATSPVVVGLAGAALFGERLGPRFWTWTVVTMSGTTWAVSAGWPAATGHAMGRLLALASVVGFTGFVLSARHRKGDLDPLGFLTGTTLVAAVVVSAHVVVTGASTALPSLRDLALVIGMVAAGGTLGHVLVIRALRRTSPSLAAVIRLAQPFLASGLAWAVLGEAVHVRHVYGGALVMIGVGGAARALSGRSRRPPTRTRSRRRA